jgi:hypothetical protein
LGRYTSGIATERVHMTSHRHAEFTPFVLDLLDFMEEKLREAIADDASHAGATSEAAGVLPLLRDRLRENEDVQAQFILVFSGYLVRTSRYGMVGRVRQDGPCGIRERNRDHFGPAGCAAPSRYGKLVRTNRL